MAESAIQEHRFRTIQLERRGPVGTIVLNKPPLNIIDMEMMAEIQAALRSLEDGERDSGADVLVFRGNGKCFSAGVSIEDHTPEQINEMIPRFHSIFRHLARTEIVTVAAVHGACLGGGFELVSMCDLVVAADHSQFGQPEIKLGQFPPVAVILLPHLMGHRKATEMLLTGGNIGANEAQAFGLVNRVVPEAQLSECLESLLSELTAGSQSTLHLTKTILRRVSGIDFERALDESERFFLHTLAQTEDAKEGIFAFLEKRAPRWTNR
jgi:cyclohexa-1,5-dienecarbonyl-CoA hydratase